MALTNGQIATVCDLVESLKCCEWLECDGFVNILHTFLETANIPHTVCFGRVFSQIDNQSIDLHFWILLETVNGNLIADTNLQRWLNLENLPHGVFNATSFEYLIRYEVHHFCFPATIPDRLIQALLTPFPSLEKFLPHPP